MRSGGGWPQRSMRCTTERRSLRHHLTLTPLRPPPRHPQQRVRAEAPQVQTGARPPRRKAYTRRPTRRRARPLRPLPRSPNSTLPPSTRPFPSSTFSSASNPMRIPLSSLCQSTTCEPPSPPPSPPPCLALLFLFSAAPAWHMYTYCATLGGGFAFASSRWCLILWREDMAGRYGGKKRREETAGRNGGPPVLTRPSF